MYPEKGFRQTPDALIMEILGPLPALQALIDENHLSHQKVLRRVKNTIKSFSQNETQDFVKKIIKGISEETDFWTDERRHGALILLRESPRVKVPKIGDYVSDAVFRLDPDVAHARGSVTSVFQAVHLCAPFISRKKFLQIMEGVNTLPSFYDDEDRTHLENFIRRIVYPSQKERRGLLRGPTSTLEEIAERMFPQEERDIAENRIIQLFIRGKKPHDIVKAGFEKQKVDAVLYDAGLVMKRSREEQEVLAAQYIAKGLSVDDIAVRLDISRSTAIRIVDNIKDKEGVSTVSIFGLKVIKETTDNAEIHDEDPNLQKNPDQEETEEEVIIRLREMNKSTAYIGKELGVSTNAASKKISKLISEGKIPRKKSGPKKRVQ